MPLIADATSIIALGEVGNIPLLRFYPEPVIVSSGIRGVEAVRFRREVDDGETQGWLRVVEANAAIVARLQGGTTSFEMGRGEAECISIAWELHPRPVDLLIDEGDTFEWLVNGLGRRDHGRNWTVVCLAQVLHRLESVGAIPSAADFMQMLEAGDHYAWAPYVVAHYEAWCKKTATRSVRA